MASRRDAGSVICYILGTPIRLLVHLLHWLCCGCEQEP